MEMRFAGVVAILFALSSCAPSTVTLLNPRSGQRVQCPWPEREGITGIYVLSKDEQDKLRRLREGKPLTPLEYCVEFHKILGYVPVGD